MLKIRVSAYYTHVHSHAHTHTCTHMLTHAHTLPADAFQAHRWTAVTWVAHVPAPLSQAVKSREAPSSRVSLLLFSLLNRSLKDCVCFLAELK